MSNIGISTLATFFFLFISSTVSFAQNDIVGYDENTEIVATGTILKIDGCQFRGLRCFVMQSNSKNINVITAPEWFLKRLHIKLHPGHEVRVVGSKFYGTDGGLYLVARSLKTLPNGRHIQFRDSKCRPVWSKRTIKRSSCMKIFYTPGHSL